VVAKGIKSNSITEAFSVFPSNKLVRSSSPGHPKPPLSWGPPWPLPEFGPVPKLASPDDNINPSENSKLSDISLKYPIPFTSLKLVPVEKVILEIFEHSSFINN
jgi:hypothetical protein